MRVRVCNSIAFKIAKCVYSKALNIVCGPKLSFMMIELLASIQGYFKKLMEFCRFFFVVARAYFIGQNVSLFLSAAAAQPYVKMAEVFFRKNYFNSIT